jgi:hypothetical protein
MTALSYWMQMRSSSYICVFLAYMRWCNTSSYWNVFTSWSMVVIRIQMCLRWALSSKVAFCYDDRASARGHARNNAEDRSNAIIVAQESIHIGGRKIMIRACLVLCVSSWSWRVCRGLVWTPWLCNFRKFEAAWIGLRIWSCMAD